MTQREDLSFISMHQSGRYGMGVAWNDGLASYSQDSRSGVWDGGEDGP